MPENALIGNVLCEVNEEAMFIRLKDKVPNVELRTKLETYVQLLSHH